MFSDNKSFVDSSMAPNGKIHKLHIALSFHGVRESIDAGTVTYQLSNGKDNLPDALSKNWAHNDIWTNLKPILCWLGDTMESFDNNSLE